MIIDWNKQCKKIHESKTLDENDTFDRKYKFRQEILYVGYLSNVLNLGKNVCFEEWDKITNGTNKSFVNDDEMKQEQFSKIFQIANSNKYLNFNINKPMQDIIIYASEINYLNRLLVPKWVKQYWLCLLIYYKFASQTFPNVYKSRNISCWAIQKTDFKSKNYGGDCQDKITSYKNGLDKKVFDETVYIDKSKAKLVYKPCFMKNKGKHFYVVNDINKIDEILSKIKNTKVKCPKCGKRHEITPYNKTFLCSKCYKKDLKERNNIAKKKCREKSSKNIEESSINNEFVENFNIFDFDELQ